MVDAGPIPPGSVLQRWIGNWIELHYLAGPDVESPHGISRGPLEARSGMFLLGGVGDMGLEAYRPPDRPIYVPWNAVLFVQGPPPEDLEQAEQTGETALLVERRELMDRLANASTPAEVAVAKGAADTWLASHPSDGDVRMAREQLEARFPDEAGT